MAFRVTAVLVGGPEDGRTVALPARFHELHFAVDHDHAAAVVNRGLPTVVMTHRATYRLDQHRLCSRWQCATLNVHRYAYHNTRNS